MHRPRLDLAALVRLQKQRRGAGGAGGGDGRLVEVTEFGANPGALRMLAHVPAGLRSHSGERGAPLVVALHGCTQTAAGYDRGCGWSEMADRLGFALLLPEQRRANNANLCFNWFEPGDAARGAGEAASVRAMVAHLVAAHGLDPERVFVTGLSAGGAMAAVMLATHPEVFAAGAVVAGLPYGAGWGVQDALRAMAQPGDLPSAARGAAVRRAGRHGGAWPPASWPRVSVWHGDADATVRDGNADASVAQWLDLHGLVGTAPVVLRRGPGHVVRRWHGADGRVRVEDHRIAGMGHGVPLSPGAGEGRCGEAGAYMLDVGVSSTHGILAFWGLEDAEGGAGAEAVVADEVRVGVGAGRGGAAAPRPIHVADAGVADAGSGEARHGGSGRPAMQHPLPDCPGAPRPAEDFPGAGLPGSGRAGSARPGGVLVVNEAGEVFEGAVPDFDAPGPETGAGSGPMPGPMRGPGGVDIAAIIEAAHRAAGLIRR